MRKLVLYGVIIFQIGLVVSLVKGIQLAIHSRSRVTDLENKKVKLVEEQMKLGEQLAYVKSDFYIEKVAREELQLAKPGEKVVIVPEGIITSDAKESEVMDPPEKNWQKWWKVIRGEGV